MDKIKKLSDAMRLGAQRRPQCAGKFFADDASCAIGAAMEATGVQHALELVVRFPELDHDVTHPLKRERRKRILFRTITNLNDRHSWTRERIANWVESIGY